MAKRKSLSTLMAEDLATKVHDGTLSPGQRLPTEADLCEEYEVSRTVVREAIARLRSEGLLVSHQGRGMFVSERPSAQKFEIDPNNLKSLPETISVLELRLSVEVESAALSAERRSDAEAAEIRRQMEKVDAIHSDPDNVQIHYDFNFHLTIAKSNHNPFFYSFLKFLEPLIVPRFRLGHLVSQDIKDKYYARIHEEHEAVVRAIELKDPEGARAAMRDHLLNSLERLRALSKAAGLDRELDMDSPELAEFAETLLRGALHEKAR